MTSSFSAKLREEQAARLRDETSISRAAKNALSYTPTVSVTANSISFGGAYRSNVQVSDSDDDGEGYDIEPTANIYRREGGPSKLTSHIKKDAIDNLRKDVLGDLLDPPPSSSSSVATYKFFKHMPHDRLGEPGHQTQVLRTEHAHAATSQKSLKQSALGGAAHSVDTAQG